MAAVQASRRLVKSPPELWAEVSDAASLAKHLGAVGEIKITRLEPETTVAWEGELASGTVELAPAGWGTSVTLTAEPIEATATTAAHPAPDPDPSASTARPAPTTAPEPPADEPASSTRRSWLRRLLTRRAAEPRQTSGEDAPAAESTVATPEPATVAEAEPAASVAAPTPPAAANATEAAPSTASLDAVLADALDSLGQAHHRPFSRG